MPFEIWVGYRVVHYTFYNIIISEQFVLFGSKTTFNLSDRVKANAPVKCVLFMPQTCALPEAALQMPPFKITSACK
jgi:hypothetical protein